MSTVDRSYPVDPSSVEVVEPHDNIIDAGVDPLRHDPLRHDRRWRESTDLDVEIRAGLVPNARSAPGSSWTGMYDDIKRLSAPLIAAGWILDETEQEESREYGDTVSYSLSRGGCRIEIELYEFGSVSVWDLNSESEEPLFHVDSNEVEAAVHIFIEQGWLAGS